MLSVIQVFAKAPLPGRVKTRLQPMLSAEQCSQLHLSLVGDVLEGLNSFNGRFAVELHLDQDCEAWREFHLPLEMQLGSDLGHKMWNAARHAFDRGYQQVMIVGSDAPTLPLSHLEELLNSPADIAFGPTEDGGYYAVMFRRLPVGLFNGVAWSSEDTLARSVAAAKKQGMSVAIGPEWYDIDTQDDLLRLVSVDLPPRTKAWLKANSFLSKSANRSI
jgi:rSAM/selenodomain-associated transferase 1